MQDDNSSAIPVAQMLANIVRLPVAPHVAALNCSPRAAAGPWLRLSLLSFVSECGKPQKSSRKLKWT